MNQAAYEVHAPAVDGHSVLHDGIRSETTHIGSECGLIPFVPDVPGLRFQTVHSYDVGEAYRLAATGDARGAFNVAAEPVIDPDALARLLHARKVPVP